MGKTSVIDTEDILATEVDWLTAWLSFKLGFSLHANSFSVFSYKGKCYEQNFKKENLK